MMMPINLEDQLVPGTFEHTVDYLVDNEIDLSVFESRYSNDQMSSLIHRELPDTVLGAAFAVHNVLGPGLLESAYEGAICVELKHRGLSLERQVGYPLSYRGEYVGAYPADLVVEGAIILELKSVKGLTAVMDAQIINYLKLSGLPVGYLLNFHNTRVEWRRFVHGDTCGCSSNT
jgi:GxxExxY protein